MKPRSKDLKSSKAKCIPPNWENTLNKNGSFIISYLDESLNRTEIENKELKEDKKKLLKENKDLKTENEDLKKEVEQLRKTVHRIFSETK